MNVLLVEPESKLHGLMTSYLRARGHRTREAIGVDDALDALRSGEFDAVVTDWQLGDDDASAIIASAHGPCIVLCPSRDEVVLHPAIAVVLVEPASPARVAAVLAELEGRGSSGPCSHHGCVEHLPSDTRDRVNLVLSILEDPNGARVDDDGAHVTIEGHISSPERWVALLDGIGGDLRVISDSDGEDEPLRLLLTLDRRGLPRGVEVAVAPTDPWPESGPFAIDLHGAEVAPDRFMAICDQVHYASRHGRVVEVINVPAHLRMCLEAVGRADDLPMRRASGPRFPEVLDELWR